MRNERHLIVGQVVAAVQLTDIARYAVKFTLVPPVADKKRQGRGLVQRIVHRIHRRHVRRRQDDPKLEEFAIPFPTLEADDMQARKLRTVARFESETLRDHVVVGIHFHGLSSFPVNQPAMGPVIESLSGPIRPSSA